MMAPKIHLTKKDGLSFALLGISCLFVFREIIFHGHLLFGADFFSLHLCTKQFLYDELRNHGSIPFWNPYIFGGIPFWAHFESTIFYPLDILFWFIRPERAYGYTVFLHVYLAGTFMFLFSRSLGIRPAGAFVSALCFMFSGLMMATIYDGQMFRVQAFTWIPLIFLFVHRALSSNEPLFNGAIAGVSWGIQIMSGAPQDALYTLIAVFLFVLFVWDWSIRLPSSGLRSAKTLGILFLVGLGIAAIQLVPSFELVKESSRGTWSDATLRTMGSYPLEGIITWILPHFYGRFAANDYWVADVPWTVPLYNLYVGVLPIVLLPFLSGGESGSRRILVFAMILAALSFLLALGSNTPVYKFITLLPGFDKIRAPAKIILLWVFVMALLAGKGMDGLLLRSKESVRRRFGVVSGVLLIIIALDIAFLSERSLILRLFSPFILEHAIADRMGYAENTILTEWHRFTLISGVTVFLCFLWARGSLKTPILISLLCGTLFVDLAYVNREAVQHNDRIYSEASRVKEELKATLGQDKSVFRVGSFRSGWGASFEMYLGYQSVGGYNPLLLHRYYEYINQYRFYGRTVPEGWIIFFYEPRENRVLMDLLNVKYEISHQTRSYTLRDSYLPRAFIVPICKVMEGKEILNYLAGPSFDPAVEVLFEKENDSPLCHEYPGSEKRSQARIVSYSPDDIRVETESTHPGFLFLSELFYPGWKAFVNGQPVRILRGNYLFRVVEVPVGKHMVSLVFDPWSIKIGVVVTLLTLLILLVWTVSLLRRKNR
jgi:hypothetical protein